MAHLTYWEKKRGLPPCRPGGATAQKPTLLIRRSAKLATLAMWRWRPLLVSSSTGACL